MKNNKIYNLAKYAVMAALLCLFGPLSVPIGPIPVSLTNLVLYFAIFIIGTKGTMISYSVYLLLGIVGLPVFSGFQGGIGKLAGPTGGYLVGFYLMVLVCGICYEKTIKASNITSIAVTVIGMIAGTAVAYLFGTMWFVHQMEVDWPYALSVCVFPFIPFDLMKIVIANILGRAVRKPLLKAGVIK